MIERPFDYDPVTGLRTTYLFDPVTEEVALRYEQDCQPILDRNKEMQNEQSGRMGEMVHVAEIPASVQLKWLIEDGIDLMNPNHSKGVKRLLNSNEYRYLKVRNIII
jgi:hypothetical protein